MEFGKILEAIVGFCEREGISCAVVGAFGLHAYGLTRATYDLDFVTEVKAQPKVIPFLESLGYETLHVSAGYSNHLHAHVAMGRLDFVYVGGETSRRLFAGCRPLLDLAGRQVLVPRPEHLIAMKFQAMKNDPGRTFQEMADIQFLLGQPGIDEREVRGYFERAGLLDRYDEIKRLL